MIGIDLNNLTQAHLDEAKPHMGKCRYSSPCIIGALLTPSHRDYLDSDGDDQSVGVLQYKGFVRVPDDQLLDAIHLQTAFDDRDWSKVEEIAHKYVVS